MLAKNGVFAKVGVATREPRASAAKTAAGGMFPVYRYTIQINYTICVNEKSSPEHAQIIHGSFGGSANRHRATGVV